MRKIIIDTDTGSDDAIAIIMAMREKSVSVKAITTVFGNIEVERATKNAILCMEKVNTYKPDVYKGSYKPIIKNLRMAKHVHGEDGLGNINLNPKGIPLSKHAVDALVDLSYEFAGDIEIVALGPLTNIALAILKDKNFEKNIKHLHIMGGSGINPGNATPLAEFNIFADAEAAKVVADSNINKTFYGWDLNSPQAAISSKDIEYLLSSGSEIAKFCVDINKTHIEFNNSIGKSGLDCADGLTMAAVLYPQIIESTYESFVEVNYKDDFSYGHLIVDKNNVLRRENNAIICEKINTHLYKKILLEKII